MTRGPAHVDPDRQVIGGPHGLTAVEHAAAPGDKVGRQGDPVQPGDGPRGMETVAGGEDRHGLGQRLQAPGGRPFVEIAGQDRRTARAVEPFDQIGGLSPAVAPQQPKMCRGQRDGATPRRKLGQNGPARLQPRKIDAVPAEDIHPRRKQDRVAMRPKAVAGPGRDDAPAVALQQGAWEGGVTGAKAQIGLLQGDHIGIDLAQDPQDPGRVAPPVETEGLADIVAGDPEQPGPLRPVLRRRVIVAIWTCFAALALAAAWFGRGELAGVAALAALLSAAPVLLASRFRIVLPLPLLVALALFLAASLIAGEAFDAYERLWWWDLLLHGTSATGFGMAGVLFVLMLFEGDRFAAPSWALTAIAICLAIAAGTLWELFEFGMDQVFGLSMQKSGLADTMGDLAVNVLGAGLGGGSGALYLAGRKRGLGVPLIAQFVRLNQRYFGRR